MKNKKSYIVLLIIIILLILVTIFVSERCGVSTSKLEQDARKSQRISADWLVAKDTTNEIGALLFYDKDLNSHTFSIYLKRDGFYYGYFFYSGGSLGAIESGIQGFSYEGKGMALFSMNEKKVAKIEVDSGEMVETITVNPFEPFSIIIPSYNNDNSISLYTSDGEEVAIDNIMGY
ncbi:hypothetical protein [Clostridium sp. Marseille-P299]|uniref:hypothetical protein n=1 Tax=Clostridium sp. Marseille-P299 TaxID=1805477 RepID=UPI000834A8A2|nr:hypothetical protein [Clostridium sp. Marseille-P299]